MSIDLNGFWQSWNVVSGNTQATNQYEFWKGMVMSNGQVLASQYDFFTYHNTTRYEWFKALQGTYPEVWDEYTFYRNTNDARIYDYYTFYQYCGEYLVNINACSGSPVPGPCIATPSSGSPGVTVFLSLTNNITGSGINYLWESGPSGTGPWTNLGFNAPTFFNSVSTTTWYRCSVTCTNSGLTTIATPVEVTIIIPTPTPTPTSTITPTPSVTATNTPTPTITPTSTVTPTITPTPSVTATNTPTPTSTVTPTITPTSSVTPTPTITPTNTVTPTPTPSLPPQYAILTEDDDFITTEGGNKIEYEN